MAASLQGLDRYSGSDRAVTIGRSGAHVVLSVEASSGSNEGEALLTPEQARAVADGLRHQADLAGKACELTGEFDV